MGRKKKKFIDKKSAVTFHLVHRSQKDPLVVDESAPSRVLAEVGEVLGRQSTRQDAEKVRRRKEEERKYGVYFDDDYDYLQHLKSVDEFQADLDPVEYAQKPARREVRGLKLPSSVFESAVKEKVGVLNKAAPISGPRLDIDPDIAAALDDDFAFDDPDNELEDDFIALATREGESGEEEQDDGEEDYDEEEEEEDSEGGMEYEDERETRSNAFTNYSMTSSVIRRNAGLKLIDAQFDRILEGEYDDTEIGALDDEGIDGRMDPNSALVLKLADEFKAASSSSKLPQTEIPQDLPDSDEDGEEMMEVVEETSDKFDCQSILSLRTNQSRYTPKVIREPKPLKINRRTGLPEGVLGSTLTTENVQRFAGAEVDDDDDSTSDDDDEKVKDGGSLVSRISSLSFRPKWETAEDRKARKGAIKQLRRERRAERKANAEAFKKERQLQLQAAMNVQLNCRGKPLA